MEKLYRLQIVIAEVKNTSLKKIILEKTTKMVTSREKVLIGKTLCMCVSVCVYVCEDKLEVRYKLDSSRDAEVLRSRVRSLANGQLHNVTIRRLTDSVSVQVKPTHHHS